MQFKDYYDILGIPRKASKDEVKSAYRRLARKFHPDVSKVADAEARFKEVGEAYEVLKDPEKRAAYDRFGADWKSGQEFRPPPDWSQEFRSDGAGIGGDARFSEFFESLFGQQGVGGGQRRRRRPAGRRGGDRQATIQVDLEDAWNGATRQIQLADTVAGGRPRTFKVKIPRGVEEGQRIRLAGQGNAGLGNGPAGDLYLEVRLSEHPIFRVEGRDIHLQLPVTPWEAALGAQIKVPTLGGAVELRVPPGSQTGSRLRLRGRGMPGIKPGDQIVELRIMTPVPESAEQEELYRRMATAMPLNPRTALGSYST